MSDIQKFLEKEDVIEARDNPAVVHEEIVEKIRKTIEQTSETRTLALNDRRFVSVSGAEWEGFYTQVFDTTPKISVNKLPIIIGKHEASYRQNKCDISFIAEDDKDAQSATAATDMFRSCRMEEGSEEAELTAFNAILTGGYGAIRVKVVSDEDGEPEIVLEPCFDADVRTYFDPSATRMDAADAEWCFNILGMSEDDFERRYPKSSCSSLFIKTWGRFDWYNPKLVYIAEFFFKCSVKEKFITYLDLLGNPFEYSEESLKADNGALEQELSDSGL
jgi:Phage P22-like portal protein